MDIKELFQSFPIIDNEFDLVAIDCVKFEDDDDVTYQLAFVFMMRNHETQTVEAGFTLCTNCFCDSLEEVIETVNVIAKLGLFQQNISAHGTIYSSDLTKQEDVNWNDIAAMSSTISVNNKYMH